MNNTSMLIYMVDNFENTEEDELLFPDEFFIEEDAEFQDVYNCLAQAEVEPDYDIVQNVLDYSLYV